MAHIAKISALTDELITLLTSVTAKSDPGKYNIYRESALRNLRSQNYLRTNQFEVADRLDGLEEKFRVYNEDALADALRERLNKITGAGGKWTAEVLYLLLELSDKPVSKSRLENLDLLKEPEADLVPTLKWEDLAKNDPLLREKSVWQNVDFAAEDSDPEEGFEDSHSELSDPMDHTEQSSVEDDVGRQLEDYAVDTISGEDLKDLRKAQFWQKTPNIGGVRLETVKKHITELNTIREVLFMLGGLPTSLFATLTLGAGRSVFVPDKSYAMKHASNDAFVKLTKSFAEQGTSVLLLRHWSKRPQSVALLQVLQSTIEKRLVDFDVCLDQVQHRFVSSRQDTVVSLLSVQAELGDHLRPLARLSEIVSNLDSERYSHAFRYLEFLYDETCKSQMAGDDRMYSFLGRVFFECFQVYLRPLRKWMEDGELSEGDKVFFVSQASGDIEPASIWQFRYKIRKTQKGVLHAPRFLQAAANKIFTTGKSVVVLKHLNRIDLLRRARTAPEPVLDFDTVCQPEVLQFASFPDFFNAAFEAWVQSKHHHASSLLRTTLFDSCGLHTSLDALSYIYFIADGITGAVFTNTIFDKLDTLNASWNDQFTLTELAQSTFGSVASVNPERLRIAVLSIPRSHQEVTKCRRTVKVLSIVTIAYQLSWPIQIILTPATLSSNQRIFTFLFQIRRSTHILSRTRLVKDELSNMSSSDERALYYSLRTRLLWFTQMLYHYLTCLVLEPCSQKMRADLKAAEDVDTMIEVYAAYIKRTTDQALLGSRLELIHKTILKILNLGIKLEDAQAANAAATKEALEHQQEMMDLSMASLGLHTPKKNGKSQKLFNQSKVESDSSDEAEEEVDVDLSILSSNYNDDDKGERAYVERLRSMKDEFDRNVRFVASGLKSMARVSDGEAAKSWDILGDMIESGLGRG